MTKPYKFRQVHIQGRDEALEWVTTFKLHYDDGSGTFLEYTDSGGTNVSHYVCISQITMHVNLINKAFVGLKDKFNSFLWDIGKQHRMRHPNWGYSDCLEEFYREMKYKLKITPDALKNQNDLPK